MTKVLLVGSGGREHAIAESIAKSRDAELYSVMSGKNPGIMACSKRYVVGKITDASFVSSFAVENKIDIAVIGPEAPLVNGIVDALEEKGIDCVGPRRALAMIEGDKAFCRALMKKYGIEGLPKCEVFKDPDEAAEYIDTVDAVVVKPAGLTGGKGVQVVGEHLKDKEEAKNYVREIFAKKIGDLQKVVVEEKLDGEEYTIQAFVDGMNLVPMPCVQDHKRAYDGDLGPNTGGMGSYSDSDHLLPFLDRENYEKSVKIMTDTIDALRKELGSPYKGILYGQFLLGVGWNKEDFRPKLVEFNCRFGDPENMNVLPLLSEGCDPVEIYQGIVDGKLSKIKATFEEKATVCKYMVPASYPGGGKQNEPFTVDEDGVKRLGAVLFYANVDMVGQQLVTTSSRTVAVLGVADSIQEAEHIAEDATNHFKGNLRHRRDIGTSELVQRRIDHVRSIRP